jgi:hypothetical protein
MSSRSPDHEIAVTSQPPEPDTQASEHGAPSPEPVLRARGVDWRIWFGMTLTVIYLGGAAYHLGNDVGWAQVESQPLDSLGNFLEGAFAPLAFLWLVIGYFLQYSTLMENNHNIGLQYIEMRQASEHAAEQARALVASERLTRQASFVKIAELVNNQLGVTAGLLFFANQRTSGLGPAQVPGPAGTGAAAHPSTGAPDPSSELWARIADGDSGVFTRRLIELCYGSAGRLREGHRLFFGTPVRRRYTAQFVKTFEGLLEAARESDVSGLLVDALVSGNAHGHLYRTILEYRREAEPEAPVPLKRNG